MTASVKDILPQFSKPEIIKIAKELGIKPALDSRASDIIKAIYIDLDVQGVPETKDGSDLLLEFLVAAEYIDENGDLIQESVDEVDEDKKLPECFGYADERDPACLGCAVLELCKTERIRTRPECYGLRFNQNEPECQGCIEAPGCKLLVLKTQKGV